MAMASIDELREINTLLQDKIEEILKSKSEDDYNLLRSKTLVKQLLKVCY